MQKVNPAEDNGGKSSSGAVPSYIQHSRELHSTLYQLLHAVAPPYPGEVDPPITFVTNGLGCLPIIAEDGIYIVKNT